MANESPERIFLKSLKRNFRIQILIFFLKIRPQNVDLAYDERNEAMDNIEQRFSELNNLALSVKEFLNKYYNHHSAVVITMDDAKVISVELKTPLHTE